MDAEKMKKLWKLLQVKLLVFVVVAAALVCSMSTLDPAPSQWKTEDVRIENVEYIRRTSRMGTGRGSGTARTVTGYLITDDNGNRYWTESDSLRLLEGATYTLTYSEDHFQRNIHGIVQGSTVYLDPALSRTWWMTDLLFFTVPLLALAAAVILMIREVKKALHRLQLEEYAASVKDNASKE